MTAEQLKKVFDPFTQADEETTRKYGGTGLGLTITKRFAEMMGGTITVRSESGKGTAFTISIPKKVKDIKQISVVADVEEISLELTRSAYGQEQVFEGSIFIETDSDEFLESSGFLKLVEPTTNRTFEAIMEMLNNKVNQD